MEASKTTHKKESVKFYFKNKADGRKSIYLERYENGKRTYEHHRSQANIFNWRNQNRV